MTPHRNGSRPQGTKYENLQNRELATTTSASSSAGQSCRPDMEEGLSCETITVSEGLDGCVDVQNAGACLAGGIPSPSSILTEARLV